MPIIVIDGPEKAGKSTLAEYLAHEHGAKVRKQTGPARPDDRIYLADLASDLFYSRQGKLVVWDRSWASEVVYGRMLRQNRRLTNRWWEAEWLYGRLVQTRGVRVMLLGESAEACQRRRDLTDLQVDAVEERLLFKAYGQLADWYMRDEILPLEADSLVLRARAECEHAERAGCIPPSYVGPWDADVLFLASDPDDQSQPVAPWLPFTSKGLTSFALMFVPFAGISGADALKCGWANLSVPVHSILRRRTLITVGKRAKEFFETVVKPQGDPLFAMPKHFHVEGYE